MSARLAAVVGALVALSLWTGLVIRPAYMRWDAQRRVVEQLAAERSTLQRSLWGLRQQMGIVEESREAESELKALLPERLSTVDAVSYVTRAARLNGIRILSVQPIDPSAQVWPPEGNKEQEGDGSGKEEDAQDPSLPWGDLRNAGEETATLLGTGRLVLAIQAEGESSRLIDFLYDLESYPYLFEIYGLRVLGSEEAGRARMDLACVFFGGR